MLSGVCAKAVPLMMNKSATENANAARILLQGVFVKRHGVWHRRPTGADAAARVITFWVVFI
jgi:hypothetical protein